MKLLTDEGDQTGLVRLIQAKVDKTFRARGPRDYRLTNDRGYMIEFIRPEPDPIYREMPGARPLEQNDVEPAPIFGLQWLVNAPAMDVVVLDERGFPAPIRCPDPRYWALHKGWLAKRDDRDPHRKQRDREQATLVAQLIRAKVPHLRFDEALLAGMPNELRTVILETELRDSYEPSW